MRQPRFLHPSIEQESGKSGSCRNTLSRRVLTMLRSINEPSTCLSEDPGCPVKVSTCLPFYEAIVWRRDTLMDHGSLAPAGIVAQRSWRSSNAFTTLPLPVFGFEHSLSFSKSGNRTCLTTIGMAPDTGASRLATRFRGLTRNAYIMNHIYSYHH